MATPVRLLRRREVETLTALPRSTLYEKVAEGSFPRPVKIGRKAVAWFESEVAAWQADRAAERDRAAQSEPQPQPAE